MKKRQAQAALPEILFRLESELAARVGAQMPFLKGR